jgi:DNA-binding CsgD family transcriptional regulator
MAETSEISVLKSIDRKLDQVINLLAMNAVKDKEEQEQIKILNSLGLTSEEIGNSLGITAGAVRWHLHNMKNKRKSKSGGKGGKQKRN